MASGRSMKSRRPRKIPAARAMRRWSCESLRVLAIGRYAAAADTPRRSSA